MNHLGQNLDSKMVIHLVDLLTSLFGKANEESDYYGIYRKWEDDNVYISIIPRSAHGSEWNAIIIGKKY